jgi:hypothetical protein
VRARLGRDIDERCRPDPWRKTIAQANRSLQLLKLTEHQSRTALTVAFVRSSVSASLCIWFPLIGSSRSLLIMLLLVVEVRKMWNASVMRSGEEIVKLS